MAIEIVTYANKSSGMFEELINNEHGVKVKVLGMGKKWNGFSDKFIGLLEYMETKNDDIDRYAGGLYIISALCHLINPQGTFTKLNLVRDSFGRKGKAKTGKPAADTKIPGVKLSSQRTAPYDTITTF